MTFQETGQVNYEIKFPKDFSAKITAKYIYDKPFCEIRYARVDGIYPAIKNTEFGLAFRYAPNEKTVRLRNERLVFQRADFDLRVRYRMGVKGVFASQYNYKVTDFSVFRKLNLPFRAGHAGIRLSGGKVWDRVPFPMLFIPGGNQGYIFRETEYNLMDYSEFVTDRYVAGQVDITFNGSPVKIVFPKSKIRINAGIRTIYGPLSENSNPEKHPELFIFGNGVTALGTKPYAEISVGLSGILKFFRVDYVYRLHEKERGGVFWGVLVEI
jgi:hypothetical protein